MAKVVANLKVVRAKERAKVRRAKEKVERKVVLVVAKEEQ